jgi:5-formyltetrahydrofolate cyclo-ligase
MESKSEIRKRILKMRNSMTDVEVKSKSQIISDKLKSLDEYNSSKTIFVYMSFGNEVDTLNLIKYMLKDNKRVVIPYTDTINTVIIPSELKSLEDDLILNKFGYYEPKFENIQKVETDELDLIIVPGVVFDKNLNRIGFGKGYYDRILVGKKPSTKAVAVAYEFQVLDEIPSEPHDIKMDMIVTEENIYS